MSELEKMRLAGSRRSREPELTSEPMTMVSRTESKAMTEAANIERQKRRQAELSMTSNSGCSKSKTCGWWSSSARRSAIPIRNEAIYQELIEAGLDDEARPRRHRSGIQEAQRRRRV
jgi:hypothetical protein